GYWPLYRYDPRLAREGKNPFQLDSGAPKVPFKEYAYNETRYRMLAQTDPELAEVLMRQAQEAVNARWKQYAALAGKGA
ncbi:MAG: hypothetical protein N2545_02005, partial [Thermoflexales bacterium]|nr:hypothetical protein [Thermoflexales bacterium]